MNNDEAKFILRAYRPSGLDTKDPMFATALQQAKHDPLLNTWFEREQSYDMVLAAKFREIMPPADLRDRILAGGRVSQKPRNSSRKLVNWLAMAASVAVIFAFSEVWQGRRVEAAQVAYAQFAVDDMQNGHHLPAQGEVLENMLAKLAQSGTSLPGSLPITMEEMKSNGCRTVKYSGQDAVEICFSRDGTWYHLYVTSRGALPRSMLKKSPAFLAMKQSAVAVWSDRNYDYAVVSPEGMNALKHLAG